jgi:hypothetical protein
MGVVYGLPSSPFFREGNPSKLYCSMMVQDEKDIKIIAT